MKPLLAILGVFAVAAALAAPRDATELHAVARDAAPLHDDPCEFDTICQRARQRTAERREQERQAEQAAYRLRTELERSGWTAYVERCRQKREAYGAHATIIECTAAERQ